MLFQWVDRKAGAGQLSGVSTSFIGTYLHIRISRRDLSTNWNALLFFKSKEKGEKRQGYWRHDKIFKNHLQSLY